MTSDEDFSDRHRRKMFWDKLEPTMQSMLKTENADVLSVVDTQEILHYLPSCKGLDVLDLGAGIGRFTSELAKISRHVTAVDISQEFLKTNQKNNEAFTNISYMCKDVTELEFPPGSFNLVFSSWILKYLNDKEVARLVSRVVQWLTPGGHFFFRESCFREIGTIKEEDNPTIFRPLIYYSDILKTTSSESSELKLLRAKNVQSYLQFQGAANQVCFLAKKIEGPKDCEIRQVLEFRYTPRNITAMEEVYGTKWIYIGQEDTVKDLLNGLHIHPGQRILDIGCGTGSSAFLIAQLYRAHVHGVDFSAANINLAIERQMKLDKDLRKMVHFEFGDIFEMNYSEGFFDVIYSRESFGYITNRQLLFAKIQRWLRPGGILFFTEMVKGASPPSLPFSSYLESAKPWSLISPDTYKEAMESAGFQNVTAIDLGDQWIKILQSELKIFDSTRRNLEDLALHDHMCDLSMKRVNWIKEDQLSWGVFRAVK